MSKIVKITFTPKTPNVYRASIDVGNVVNVINGVGTIELVAGGKHWLTVAGFGTPGQTVEVTLENAKTTTSGSTKFNLVLAASGQHAGKGAKVIKITVDS